MDYTLHHGDCLEILPTLAEGSVDLVLTDPPYGTTACKWDSVIPFEPMWRELKRAAKAKAAIVLFGSQPFTSALIMSNPRLFRYEFAWDKVNRNTGSLNANRMPLKRHENLLVFYSELPQYNPQMSEGKPYVAHNTRGHGKHTEYGHASDDRTTVNRGTRYPSSVLSFPADIKTEMGLHPTQKPVDLLRYLIRTYTQEGETVLDFTMGSGSTGVAALLENRKFIGIEKDENYFNIAKSRIEAAMQKSPLFAAI